MIPALVAALCTPAPLTPAERVSALRRTARQSTDLVYVEVTRRAVATMGSEGEARVLLSFKRRARVGARIRFVTYAGSMCGVGDVSPGQRYLIWLTNDPVQTLLPPSFKELAEAGILRVAR